MTTTTHHTLPALQSASSIQQLWLSEHQPRKNAKALKVDPPFDLPACKKNFFSVSPRVQGAA
ncbi:hypothetical protein BKA66DRAFT_33995 [Pyrenochaeta sp. MPI-SDFR-AT-0127]|nr:hypothetical protein BKA66DRAFT_33995 [Pyrenochaeta sp. MPI-SDFR-AT-0127]